MSLYSHNLKGLVEERNVMQLSNLHTMCVNTVLNRVSCCENARVNNNNHMYQ